MRTVKILLIIVLLAVSVLYGITTVSEKFTGAHVPPTLKCDTDTLEVSVHDDVNTYLTGVTASDQQDGDLTGNIYISGVSKLISAGTAKVTYLVFDSDHNMASLTRFLHYTDYRSPRFSIKEPLVYGQNESIALLDWVSEHLPGTPVSLMRQYIPMNGVDIRGLDRPITEREYRRVRDHMLALDLPGFLQEPESASTDFVPLFCRDESYI